MNIFIPALLLCCVEFPPYLYGGNGYIVIFPRRLFSNPSGKKYGWGKMTIYDIAISLPVVKGNCKSFMHDIINCYGLYNVFPTRSPDSVLTLCDQYYPMCNAKVSFLNCYLNAFAKCDNYRQYNPLLFDELTIKTVLLGCCDRRQVFEEGKQCAGDFYKDLHMVLTFTCYNNDEIAQSGFASVAASNWTSFCSSMEVRYRCISSIILPLNCSAAYYETARHLFYAILPPACQNNSDAFYWINRYGINSCSKTHMSVAVIGLSIILYFLRYL